MPKGKKLQLLNNSSSEDSHSVLPGGISGRLKECVTDDNSPQFKGNRPFSENVD